MSDSPDNNTCCTPPVASGVTAAGVICAGRASASGTGWECSGSGELNFTATASSDDALCGGALTAASAVAAMTGCGGGVGLVPLDATTCVSCGRSMTMLFADGVSG